METPTPDDQEVDTMVTPEAVLQDSAYAKFAAEDFDASKFSEQIVAADGARDESHDRARDPPAKAN